MGWDGGGNKRLKRRWVVRQEMNIMCSHDANGGKVLPWVCVLVEVMYGVNAMGAGGGGSGESLLSGSRSAMLSANSKQFHYPGPSSGSYGGW